MRISKFSASVSLAAIALVHAGRAAAAVTAPAPAPAPQPRGVLLADAATKLNTKAPKGFEDLDSSVSTQFDVTFLGRPVGAFAATFKDGQIQFLEPAKVAAALGAGVDTVAVTAFLSKPLFANEQFRCRPGQSPNVGCGILPAGTSGVIVNVESFNVSLFLARDYLAAVASGPRILGAPESGPSLIQGVRMSAASVGGGRVTYGGIFDTLASVGRNALIGQATLTSEDGLRTQQLYARRWA